MLDQALFAAQSRVKAVSEFIDTRRGSIGPEARTRLSEAARQLDAAQAKRTTNPTEAIAHANGAASLAAQAQSLANDDVRKAQVSYAPQYGRQSDMGSVIGGIIIGNILRGGMGGDGRYGRRLGWRLGRWLRRRLRRVTVRRTHLLRWLGPQLRRRPLLDPPVTRVTAPNHCGNRPPTRDKFSCR